MSDLKSTPANPYARLVESAQDFRHWKITDMRVVRILDALAALPTGAPTPEEVEEMAFWLCNTFYWPVRGNNENWMEPWYQSKQGEQESWKALARFVLLRERAALTGGRE